MARQEEIIDTGSKRRRPRTRTQAQARPALVFTLMLSTLTLGVGLACAALWPTASSGRPLTTGIVASATRDDAGAGDAAPEFAGVVASRRLVWFDRDGHMTPLAAPLRGYAYPRLAPGQSPGGDRIVVDVRDEAHGLWWWDESTQQLTPLSVGRASDIAPLWTHDGVRLLFARGRGVTPGIFQLDIASGQQRGRSAVARPASPTAPRRLPIDANSLLMPSSLTPDDRRLLVTASVASGFDILVVDWQAGGPLIPLVTSAADDLNAEVSPDGGWIAFQSRAGGQFDIWLAPMPDRRLPFSADQAPLQLTTSGGTRPVWTRNGSELLYLTTDGDVMTIAVTAAAPDGAPAAGHRVWPKFGVPVRLFRAEIYQDLVGRTFDVSASGDRILAIVDGAKDDASVASRPAPEAGRRP